MAPQVTMIAANKFACLSDEIQYVPPPGEGLSKSALRRRKRNEQKRVENYGIKPKFTDTATAANRSTSNTEIHKSLAMEGWSTVSASKKSVSARKPGTEQVVHGQKHNMNHNVKVPGAVYVMAQATPAKFPKPSHTPQIQPNRTAKAKHTSENPLTKTAGPRATQSLATQLKASSVHTGSGKPEQSATKAHHIKSGQGVALQTKKAALDIVNQGSWKKANAFLTNDSVSAKPYASPIGSPSRQSESSQPSTPSQQRPKKGKNKSVKVKDGQGLVYTVRARDTGIIDEITSRATCGNGTSNGQNDRAISSNPWTWQGKVNHSTAPVAAPIPHGPTPGYCWAGIAAKPALKVCGDVKVVRVA